jgi:hypothetical protein
MADETVSVGDSDEAERKEFPIHTQPDGTVFVGDPNAPVDPNHPDGMKISFKEWADCGPQGQALIRRIANDFVFHAATDEAVVHYAAIRAAGRLFAETVAAHCPPGREVALAVTNAEQAVAWANKGVACQTTPATPDAQASLSNRAYAGVSTGDAPGHGLVPQYALRLARAVATGEPLDLQNVRVPNEIQALLSQLPLTPEAEPDGRHDSLAARYRDALDDLLEPLATALDDTGHGSVDWGAIRRAYDAARAAAAAE